MTLTNNITQRNGLTSLQPHREPKWAIAIKNFSPQFFTISMDTGILSIILNLHPWHFSGQGILSTILFVFNLFIFTLLSLVGLARVFKFPRHVLSQTFSHEEELSYLGAPATAYLTLVAQVALTCSTAWGPRWTTLAVVLWWIGAVWTISLTSFSIIVLAKRNITYDREVSPAIFLPLISVMTLGTTAGVITRYSADISAGVAIPIIVVGYMAIGYAFFLSLLYYAYLTHKLLAAGLPAPAKIPSLVITIGPMGQFATAIQILSSAANTRGLFGAYDRGTWVTGSAASSVSATATLMALLALGFGFLWITVSWYVVGEALVRRRLVFGVAWWSLIFPMGVYTTALINLSIAMNSDAFRGLTSTLLIFLFIIYVGTWIGTVYRMWQGTLFGIPQQRTEEDEQARNKKERLDRYLVRNGGANGSTVGTDSGEKSHV